MTVEACDVCVVGLGAMGSAAAWQLARRGADVIGIEQYAPAHDLGSSHGETRMIRTAYFEHPGYVPLVRRAVELWRELEAETGTCLLEMTGGLVLGERDSPSVAGALASAARWGLAHRLLGRDELVAEHPAFAPPPAVVALWEPDAGFLRPEAAVAAQLRRAGELGARLRFGERVLGWGAVAGGSGVEVRTAAGRVRARSLVLSPGAWAPQLLAGSGPPLVVERQVLHWFEPTGGTEPYRLGRFPVWIFDRGPGLPALYGFPALGTGAVGTGAGAGAGGPGVGGAGGGVGGVKVAFHHGGEACTPAGIRRDVRPGEVEAIGGALGSLLPGLPGRHLRAVTCLYTNSPDHHFVVGDLPGAPGIVVACGFSGHGFKFAPAIGEALAELATGVAPGRLPLELFSPARA